MWVLTTVREIRKNNHTLCSIGVGMISIGALNAARLDSAMPDRFIVWDFRASCHIVAHSIRKRFALQTAPRFDYVIVSFQTWLPTSLRASLGWSFQTYTVQMVYCSNGILFKYSWTVYCSNRPNCPCRAQVWQGRRGSMREASVSLSLWDWITIIPQVKILFIIVVLVIVVSVVIITIIVIIMMTSRWPRQAAAGTRPAGAAC